jgi:hypothetical protein
MWRPSTAALRSGGRFPPDGDVQLEVKQTVSSILPATTGIGERWTTIHHSAKLHRIPEGWKVAAFDAKYLDMGENRRR